MMAVEMLLPTGAHAHTRTRYGAVTAVTLDIEPYSKERSCCFISKKASTIIELLCLLLAVFIIIGIFSAPIVYRYYRIVSKHMHVAMINTKRKINVPIIYEKERAGQHLNPPPYPSMSI